MACALRARIGDSGEFGEMESCCVRVDAGHHAITYLLPLVRTIKDTPELPIALRTKAHRHTTHTQLTSSYFLLPAACLLLACLGCVFDSCLRLSFRGCSSATRAPIDKRTSRAGRAYFSTSGGVFAAWLGCWVVPDNVFVFLIVLPKKTLECGQTTPRHPHQ